MGNAITTLLMVGVMLVAVATLSQGTFSSMATLADSWREMEVRTGEISRTALAVVSTTNTPPTATVTLSNSGQTSLRDFAAWDVAMDYYETDGTYHQVWLQYLATHPPGNNQWALEGIYSDAGTSAAEVFQPGILDPGEEMVITIQLSPAARTTGLNLVVVGTPNGVSVSTTF